MSVLVVVDHDNAVINASTFNTLGAATQVTGDIDLLVMGHNCDDVINAAMAVPNVRQVLSVQSEALENPVAENMAAIVVKQAADYSHILASSSTSGKNLLPRVAALLDVAQVSDISAVIDAETFERPIYAGNVLATVRCKEKHKVMTVLSTKFDAVAQTGGRATELVVEDVAVKATARFVERTEAGSEGPQLASARVIVSGGRGMGSQENFALLETLAETLGGAVGASRAAVDAGFAPNDYQVGQTGKMVAPELYIAVGISGAIQHLAGMKDSQTIVAINKDPDAPIFNVADIGIVGDLFTILPELNAALR